jgi:hypothetical protein
MLAQTVDKMGISKEDMEKAQVGMLPSLADCVTIIRHPEDGSIMMVVTKKGTMPVDSKRIMCDDVDTAMDFIRGFFPKTEEPKNMPQILEKPREIGFLSKAA